jgi:Ca-activated chloride channel family protein
MADFHFLRPLWLLALPLGAWLAWRLLHSAASGGAWQSVVDEPLQPYVLTGTGGRARRWPFMAALLAWTLAVLALAGPTWDRQPVPVFRSNEALVVALDLSRSMDATDLPPSRLARAKLKLLDLLERRRSGQTALVVFTAHAFTVTPLTTDTRTIAALIGSLSSDIMPSRGSYPEAGLEKAARLLRQTGVSRGEILLVSDADVSSNALRAARDLNREGFAVDVLAVGTEQGAPIAEPKGGFLTDGKGQVVIPRLNVRGLSRLAEIGGGRFAVATADDSDLDALFPAAADSPALAADGVRDESRQANVWLDQGRWLVLALLPLVALAFRRGWVAGWLIWLLVPPPAHAFSWQDWWQRPDQQGYRAMQEGESKHAADLFDDPQWRAAAQYRAGDYTDSAASLAGIDTAEANYNRGNALARAGRLDEAVEAYQRALELDPDHADARHNLDLLKQQRDRRRQQSGGGQKQGSNDDRGRQGEAKSQPSGQSQSRRAPPSASGEDTEPQRPQGGREEPARQRQAQSGEGAPPSRARSEAQSGERQARTGSTGEPPGDRGEESERPVDADDVQQWASEQAADQWLRRIPQDPGGLLRRKFLYQYQRLGVDQDGHYVWPGDETQPW